MSGDYTRFTFDPAKRFSGVLLQQGRVQLDSDWNEAVDIVNQRVRKLSLDLFGPVGVPALVSPDAFLIGIISGTPLDLSIGAGRIYADGWMAENFVQNPPATYLNQPFLPNPDPLGGGNYLAYLDLWQRELTYIEDPDLLDVALGGVDTATRIQQVWQLRLVAIDARAECGVDLNALFPPSAGRLSVEALAPPTPDDPCVLPPIAGYRGLENRLYRLEVHEGGPLGTARFRWSRDGGSIVSAVTGLAIAGTTTRLTVNRIGRDRMLRFRIDDWVSVTDDHRELDSKPVAMARIVDIDEAARQIVVDRPLAGFAANTTDLAARHTRVQRWDQRSTINAIDGDGLMTTAAGPTDLEDGIRVSFDMEPAGGNFRTGDYWLFAARTATAWVEPLDHEPPRGIHHVYVPLAAINGLGGANDLDDCRPKPVTGDCCCICLPPAEGSYIQDAIDALPDAGGCICLLPGEHRPDRTIMIRRSNVTLKAESGGAVVLLKGEAPVLVIGDEEAPVTDILVSRIVFTRSVGATPPALIIAYRARQSRIEYCGIANMRSGTSPGISLTQCNNLSIDDCRFFNVSVGIISGGSESAGLAFRRNFIWLDAANRDTRGAGIWLAGGQGNYLVEENFIQGPGSGVRVTSDSAAGLAVAAVNLPQSTARFVRVENNIIASLLNSGDDSAPGFGIELAAGDARASGNYIYIRASRDLFAAGIWLSGSDQVADGNRILGAGEANPIHGILVGNFQEEIWDLAVADNRITDCRAAITAGRVSELEISGNHISAPEQAASQTVGLFLLVASSAEIADNDIRDVTSAILIGGGRFNRLSGNDLSRCGTGIWMGSAALPEITGNRIREMESVGLAVDKISLSCEVSGNHLDRCGFGQRQALALVATNVYGELTINSNEVRDTGLDSNYKSTSATAFGIVGYLVLTASVSDNFVTYSNILSRPTSAEDRALFMLGMTSIFIKDRIIGFPAIISDNKFYGAGRSALIEIQHFPTGATYVGFDRVTFSNNYCFHSTDRPSDTLATVNLKGNFGIAMGNHIQAADPFASFDFNGMKGPVIGNVMAGGVLNHPDFPVMLGQFNMFPV